MASNFHQEMRESLVNLTEKRLKRHSHNYSDVQRKVSSSLSDIKTKHKCSYSLKPQHQPKIKTEIHQNKQIRQKRYRDLKQDTTKFIDYLKLLKKRRNSHFILPYNSNIKQKNDGRSFISLLGKNKKKNSIEYCMQNKKHYHEAITRQKQIKQTNKFILQQNGKVFPSLNSKQVTPNNHKNAKRNSPKILSIQQLKAKMQAKWNKKIKLSIIDEKLETKNVQVYVNEFINTQYFSQTLKALKFQKKQDQFLQQRQQTKYKKMEKKEKVIHKQSKILENKNKINKPKIYKILPNSFEFKQPKIIQSTFSPWESKSSNFIDILG